MTRLEPTELATLIGGNVKIAKCFVSWFSRQIKHTSALAIITDYLSVSAPGYHIS